MGPFSPGRGGLGWGCIQRLDAPVCVLGKRGTGRGPSQMIKSELIEKLASENTHLTHAEVERVVNIVLGRMVDSLGDGGRVDRTTVQHIVAESSKQITFHSKVLY